MKNSIYHMRDSSADHKHNTVLLFFADAIDPLGFKGIVAPDLFVSFLACLSIGLEYIPLLGLQFFCCSFNFI